MINVALKMAIIEARFNQRQVSDRVHISEGRLSAIIHHRQTATDTEQRALAKLLKRPVDVLFPEVTR